MLSVLFGAGIARRIDAGATAACDPALRCVNRDLHRGLCLFVAPSPPTSTKKVAASAAYSTAGAVNGLVSRATGISAGGEHTCAVLEDGSASCWGDGARGELGDATKRTSPVPVSVVNLEDRVATISAGAFHNCVVLINGSANCWGYNQYGQLGDGTWTGSSTPRKVQGLTTAMRSISAGDNQTCAVTVEHVAVCWGSNVKGELGDGTTVSRAKVGVVTGLDSPVDEVSAGHGHSCALMGGSVACWGDNTTGQVGSGPKVDRTGASRVPSLASAKVISAGSGHSCVVLTDGGIRCWGNLLGPN